jgi:phage portal protein BeeE
VPNLLQALRSRPTGPVEPVRHITSVDDYLGTLNQLSFSYGGADYGLNQVPSGLTGTYGAQPAESIPNDLTGYAQAAYAANGVVFAVMAVRMLAFSAVRFQWQRINAGRPSEMFGSASLNVLEQPWLGGTTQDLLLRVIQDADLAGNSYWVDAAQVGAADSVEGVRVAGPQAELVRLRPDWVNIVLAPRMIRGGQVGWRRLGYVYWEDGPGGESEPVAFLPDEVVHFAPNPDPLATYRGMSWLTPVLREVENDKAMGRHKSAFFANSATPNLSVSLDKDVSLAAFQAFKAAMDAGHRGPDNAGKTLYLGGGADVKVIGADFQAMDFKSIQGHGETRIAAAGGVPPIIVGLSEGLESATYSNYSQARRRFADGTMHPLWQNAAGCFANIVPRPPGANDAVRLWYDARDVPFLREDQSDAAQIQATQASTINTLITAGFTPESSVKAVSAEDWALLTHSGLTSVQLQAPGETAEPAPATPTPEVTDD